MPTLPAWAALISLALMPFHYKRRQILALAVLATLFPLVKFIQNANSDATYDEPRNQQALVKKYLGTHPESSPLFFAGKRLYAAEFYLNDINYVTDPTSLPAEKPYYLAMRSGREPFSKPTQCEEQPMTNEYRFFYCEPS